MSLSEEIDICLPYPEEDDINESKVESSEIQQPALLTTDISDDDLLWNLRAQLKNMMAVNERDTDGNNGVSYKNHIEISQKQSDFLKGEISRKIKLFVI